MKAPLNLSQSVNSGASEGAGFFVVEADGHISEINSAMAVWLGLSQGPVAPGALHYSSILSPDALATWEKQWHALTRQGFVSPFALTFKKLDGKPLVARVSMMDFSGSIGCMVQTEAAGLQDTQHPTEEREAQFRILVNAVSTQIFDMAPDRTLRYVNRPVLDFFGPDQEEAIKAGAWAKDIHPEDLENLTNTISQAMHTQKGYTLEVRARNRQGEYRWLLSTVVPSFYPNGDFYGLVGTNVDITERKEIELALKTSEERFRIIADASPAHIFDMAPDGTFRFLNQAVKDFLPPERMSEIMEGRWNPEVHPDDMENFTRLVQQALEGKLESYRIEFRSKHQDGGYRWFFHSGTRCYYPSGDFYGLVGYTIDISALKETELELKTSEERFRIIANASPAHIFDMAPEGSFRFLNQAALDFISPESMPELMKGNWVPAIHPDDLENVTRLVQNALAGQREAYRLEIRFKRRDGVYRWFLHSGMPTYYPNGDFYGLVGYSIDISALKEAEFALRLSEARWREMANAVPIMLWVSNTQGEAVFINDWWYQYTGLTPEELLGKQWMDVVHPDDRDLAMAITQQYLMGDPFEIECRYRNAKGEYRWHLSRVTPVKDADGNMLNWCGSSLDIHDRRIMEQEVGRARDVAEAANKKKSQFLANMSHELRTPLNAVIGFSDMLKKGMAGSLTDKQGNYVEHIATSGRHLLAMVNDILDISMAEAGKIKVSFAYIELAPFISQLQEMISYSAQKGGVALTFHVETGLMGLVGDADRLRQIFLNLIGNAVKFNHAGGRVDVTLSRSEDHQWVIVEIQDTGIGIPADQVDKLFSEFYQVDTSNTRQYEGTGLGLALTRRLVELHHGSIAVESEEGVGSTFTIRLPQNPQSLSY